MHLRLLILGLLLSISTQLVGQGSNLPLGNRSYHILDRLEIRSGKATPFHSSLRYYTRGAVTRFALTVDTARVALTIKDRRDLYYIFRDNNEWLGVGESTPIGDKRADKDAPTQIETSLDNARYTTNEKGLLKHFYKTPANLFEVNEPAFHLRVNPLILFRYAATNEEFDAVTNLRGLQIRGGVDDRIYFFFNILETQASFPEYVKQRIQRDQALPGNGFYKGFDNEFFNIREGYDFLNGQGYLGFNVTRHVGMQFGYGRNFIGNGHRSMLLSDFANNYLYLKINWQVWKFHYQNIFAELSEGSARSVRGDNLIPKKYMAAHHLSFNILPNLNVGIFETVIFSRQDRFDFRYLNPIMFYRITEQGLGSPDNVMIGLDAKWNFLRQFQLYGQFVLDEFVYRELIVDRNGWWANKYGYQLGLKYINALGVDHLDMQVELNGARPYTYTHRDSVSNYAHYNQPLAHPLGANFREWLMIVKYQPLKRLFVEGRVIAAEFGEDADGTNWGGNILLPNRTREQEYENVIGQGVGGRTLLFGIDVSYEFYHNMFVDLHYFYRNKDSDDDLLDLNTQYFGGGLRINIAKQRMDF
jgi:hypothetical protein